MLGSSYSTGMIWETVTIEEQEIKQKEHEYAALHPQVDPIVAGLSDTILEKLLIHSCFWERNPRATHGLNKWVGDEDEEEDEDLDTWIGNMVVDGRTPDAHEAEAAADGEEDGAVFEDAAAVDGREEEEEDDEEASDPVEVDE
ncbi:hypothetical protein HDU87_001583 [Geranomyces variabilis]|uniref:Uncharacterized protein n=1 Tax=Geranomyces variabilis TaxID=109894 RepID=A0AAD5XNU2_9FUNG|nr:hypothetical protein HDU87_001583 [Geranomyces variabilis]